MSESAQLLYIKLILAAAVTYNEIPKKYKVITELVHFKGRRVTFECSLSEVKNNFKRFKETDNYYYFDEFEQKTNYLGTPKELPGKSRGLPKEALYIDKEKEKDIERPNGASAKRCLAHYGQVFLNKTGSPYHATFGKDMTLFKDILKTHSEEQVIILIEQFFESDDLFIKKAGKTIGVFKSMINKLVSSEIKPELIGGL